MDDQPTPDPSSLEIRPVRPDEYEEAGRVTADAYREFVPVDGPDEDWLRYLESLADVAGRVDRTAVLVAVRDGRVLGCVTLEEDATVGDDDERPEPGTTHVRMLGVDPSARGQGVGRALMLHTIERARLQGRRAVTLRTTEVMVA